MREEILQGIAYGSDAVMRRVSLYQYLSIRHGRATVRDPQFSLAFSGEETGGVKNPPPSHRAFDGLRL